MLFKQLSALALAGYAFAQETPTLAEALESSDNLSQLGQVIALVPGLTETLSSAEDITILAPSNEAFGRVPNATLQRLTSNPEMLGALLQYHVLNGTYPASSITNMTAFVPSLLTNEMYTNVTGGQVVSATANGENVTFVSGFGDMSMVSQADVNFTGGVIHVIDHVLTLPTSPSDTALAAGLTSLAGALNATDLISTVDGLSDVTIFAPSNEAFQAIASGLDGLSPEDTTNVLTYHVVQGTVGYSSGLENGTTLSTVNGANLTITINDGAVFVNNARVVQPDVLVSNGVVHVIDAVLNPSNTTVAEPSATEGSPAFSGASSASEAPFTSEVPSATRSLAPPMSTPSEPSESDASEATGAAAPKQTAAVGAILGLGAAVVHFL